MEIVPPLRLRSNTSRWMAAMSPLTSATGVPIQVEPSGFVPCARRSTNTVSPCSGPFLLAGKLANSEARSCTASELFDTGRLAATPATSMTLVGASETRAASAAPSWLVWSLGSTRAVTLMLPCGATRVAWSNTATF